MTEEGIDPDFSRLSARVLNCVYFYREPEDTSDRQGVADFFNNMTKERNILFDAVRKAGKYEDLEGEGKEIFDKVKEYAEQQEQDQEWTDRFTEPVGLQISPEAMKSRGPDAEESKLLTAAILQAMEEGDEEKANKIAALAKTPEKIYEIAEGLPPVGVKEQGEKEEPKSEKKVKSSPFRRK